MLTRVTAKPHSRVADLLAEAAGVGIVQPQTALDQFSFTHALVRDVLYARTPAARLRALHRRVGETIEGIHAGDLDDHVDLLADHYVLALPDADPRRALEYSHRAGARALAILAYQQAARHLDRAVELAALAGIDDADRIELLLELGDAHLRAGDWSAAGQAYEKVAAAARRRGRPDVLARAALGFGAGLSGFEVRLFDQRQLDLLRAALDELDEDDVALRAWVLARLSVAESYSVNNEVRVAHSQQAVEQARRVADPKLLAYALSSYCDAVPGPDHTARRRQLADEMVQLGIASNDAESELLGRRFRIVALLESGDLTAVDKETEAFVLTAARLRWPLVEWYPPLWRGTRALMQGRLGDADRLASEVRDIGQRAGSVNAEMTSDAQLLRLAIERGRSDEAYRLGQRFLGDAEAGPNSEAFLVLLLVRLGRHAEARALLDRLTAAGFPLQIDAAWLEIMAAVAEGCAELNHAEAARSLLKLLQPYAERFVVGTGVGGICLGSMNRYLGLLASCLGQWDDATSYFRLALTANRSAGATLMVAHTLRQHAGMLRKRNAPGDRAEAESMLAEASETYRQLGLDHWLAHAPESTGADEAVFRREGDVWLIGYAGRRILIRNTKGMAVLARLLAEPGREFHVFDLIDKGNRETRFAAATDTGEVIDIQARQAYKRRLDELDADLDDAALSGDIVRKENLQRERDSLINQLTAAYGLGGKARRGNDLIERARSAVTKQIRSAISRIEPEHSSLALHLTNAVRTGRYCSYAPEHPVSWQL